MNGVLQDLLAIATRYAGQPAQPGDFIYRDLNINGSDIIEFVEEVERRFGISLEWVSPRKRSSRFQDATIQSIAESIDRQRS